MAGDSGDRMKIVIGYAVWATLCAAVAGVAISFIHTWFFSYHATPAGILADAPRRCGGDGRPSPRPGRRGLGHGQRAHPARTWVAGHVLLGLLVGLFDFLMNFFRWPCPPLGPSSAGP